MKKLCVTLLLSMLLCAAASAKTVVCVSGSGDGYVNNGEGYHRAAGHDVTVGGDLTECLDQVEDGDCLVIVAHGGTIENEEGEVVDYGFFWGDDFYEGFGDGEGEVKVPDDFKNLKNVTVKFEACWSDCDGEDGTSLVDDLVGELGGGGNTGTGYPGLVDFSIYWVVKGGTADERQRANDCLSNNTGWQDNPPVNRPGNEGPNQQTAAQDQLNRKGLGHIRVCIPDAVGQRPGPDGEPPCRAGYLPPVAVNVADPVPNEHGYYEIPGVGYEPDHDYVALTSPDGQWTAQVEVNSSGVGQVVGLFDNYTDASVDQVFEVLHYLAVGYPGEGQYVSVEDSFKVLESNAEGNTFSAYLQGMADKIDLSWLEVEIQSRVVSDTRGVVVDITFHAVGDSPNGYITPLVYVDMEVDHDRDGNTVDFDRNFIQAGSDTTNPMELYVTGEGGFQSMPFPDLAYYLMDAPGMLENSIDGGPGNMTFAVEGQGTKLNAGESLTFSYCLGRSLGVRVPDKEPQRPMLQSESH